MASIIVFCSSSSYLSTPTSLSLSLSLSPLSLSPTIQSPLSLYFYIFFLSFSLPVAPSPTHTFLISLTTYLSNHLVFSVCLSLSVSVFVSLSLPLSLSLSIPPTIPLSDSPSYHPLLFISFLTMLYILPHSSIYKSSCHPHPRFSSTPHFSFFSPSLALSPVS